MMAVVSSMLVERTDRGDEMFLTMLDRHTSHVLDTGALDILPPPSTAAALTPDPADEGAHQPGDEPLWNESWYWDFADPAQGIGGWLRLGLVPNQNVAWINALVCGPDMPTVALVNFEAPMPSDPSVAKADGAELRHGAITPLQTYRVEVRGTALEYDDPSALLRDEPGRPVELAMDLTWTTVGTPYAYRITTRYEIPCTVTGTVTIDGKVHRFEAVPGSVIIPTACVTGGAWTGSGAPCTSTTAPTCTVSTCASQAWTRSASATCSAPANRSPRRRLCVPKRRSPTTGYR